MTEGAGVLVVDAANVVGSRPDGWWNDRVGAAERLLAGLAAAVARGDRPDLAARRIVVVLEGRANEAAPGGVPGIEIVRAPRDGDGAIVDVVGERAVDDVLVVTSDRELRRRVQQRGASVRGAGWLRDVLDAAQP
ncbi:MAG: hypothetical protein KQH57_02420 [Actinomycetales bacterium]|nr:hypothetical protein [Actinomycetales bacterium]